ncbi:TPA: serine acetyltransferase [Clostridium perfringens]|nr:serine acetyltransferase [Clostridium perfringens]HAT4126730.1 serine acetyltransferase [Clostridium perfringens]
MVNFLVKYKNTILISKLVKLIFIIIGVDIPKEVKMGKNIIFPHNSYGTVIHPNTEIEDNVRIYQNVTIGRADIYLDFKESLMEKITIGQGAILCAGCKVLSKERNMRVGKNSIIAANSVLLCSTGDNEIWAGIPAKRIGYLGVEND